MTTTGNPHFDISMANLQEGLYEGDVGPAQIRATLALAYEQRTANLIALATMDHSFYGSKSPKKFNDIDARLGLTVEPPAAGTINVPAPVVPYKGPGHPDSYYMLTAARNLEQGYAMAGGNVTRTIIKLLNDTAEALQEAGN